jgi:hypothetical protein
METRTLKYPVVDIETANNGTSYLAFKEHLSEGAKGVSNLFSHVAYNEYASVTDF